jgi:hypothetical protein
MRGWPSYAQAGVEVQERLDGSLVVCYQGQILTSSEAPQQPVTLRARKGTQTTSAGKSEALGRSGQAIGERGHPRQVNLAKPGPEHP